MDPGRECFRTLIFVAIHHFYHWCWLTPTTLGFFPTRPRTRKRTSLSSSSRSRRFCPRLFPSSFVLVFSSSFVQSPLLCSRKFQSGFLFLSPSRRRRHPIGATMMMISRRRFLRAKNFEKKKTETKAREETPRKVVVLLSKFVA